MSKFAARKLTAAGLICLLFLFLTVLGAGSAAPGELRVSFIDVGQGDAALLQDASSFDVLIDGGPSTAGEVVPAYLRQAGIDDIDVLVASHTDEDHVSGLVAVLEATDIAVEAIVINGYPATSDIWADFLAAAASRGLTPTVAYFPQEYVWGEMSVQVLNPGQNVAGLESNEASLVLLVRHADVSFLFSGDIDSGIEEEILARGTPVAAQVLKVAHHGSASSSSAAFLEAVSPQHSIISVGENNYGHPADETLARLVTAGSQVWRTDWHGSIQVLSDGWAVSVIPETVRVQLFLPLVVRSAPPTAAAQIDILAVFADGSSTQEADEYVEIKNTGSQGVNFQSWTLKDKVNHTFTFPALIMQPGQVCRVYTNQLHPQWCSLSYGSDTPIWNNDGDCAYLSDASGKLVDSYCY